MSLWRDRDSRRFMKTVAGLSFLLLGVTVLFLLQQSQSVKQMLLHHNGAVAGALLQQGVPPGVVASAISSREENSGGGAFLRQIGFTEQTDTRFLPAFNGFAVHNALSAIVVIVIFIGLLLAVCIIHLNRRERLYLQASDVIQRYTDEDFSVGLPRDDEGTLYKLFGSVNNLATALQAKGEAQYQAKEFLKRTISDISHQLKTPLAALQMYNEIITDAPDNPKAVASFSQKTASAIGRMEQLIQALLKMTRLDAGVITFEKKPCPISEVVAQAVEGCEALAAPHTRRIKVSGPPDEQVLCDLKWTREALGNIIQNAIDHSDPDGLILINWERFPGMVRLTIEDQGDGIAPEDIHHIFKRFYRSSRSRSTQGLGLGLPLAKAIIEGQQGILSVQSTFKAGTTFTVSFLTKP